MKNPVKILRVILLCALALPLISCSFLQDLGERLDEELDQGPSERAKEVFQDSPFVEGQFVYKGIVYEEHTEAGEFPLDPSLLVELQEPTERGVPSPLYTTSHPLALPFDPAMAEDFREDVRNSRSSEAYPIDLGVAPHAAFPHEGYLFAPQKNGLWRVFSPVQDVLEGKIYVRGADRMKDGSFKLDVDEDELDFERTLEGVDVYSHPGESDEALYVLREDSGLPDTLRLIPKEKAFPYHRPPREEESRAYRSRYGDISVEFNFSETWRVTETEDSFGKAIYLFGPKDVAEDYYPAITIWVFGKAVSGAYQTLQQAIWATTVGNQSWDEGSRVVRAERTKLNGLPALGRTVEGPYLWPTLYEPGQAGRWRFVVARKGKTLIILSYASMNKDFDKHHGVFEQVLEGFSVSQATK